MSSPKEKAKDLHSRFMKPVDDLHKYPMCFDTAKQCALIAVDEIIINGGTTFVIEYPKNTFRNGTEYWKEVKKEIELL